MKDERANTTRTKARKRALDILFESDLRQSDALETLADRISAGEPPVRPFTAEIVQGVQRSLGDIDGLIVGALAPGWSLERMPRVDRNLARIAIYEMLHADTPPQIAVKEAVDLAAEYSTDDSPGFLNGLLGTIMAQVHPAE